MKTDLELQEDVIAELAWDPAIEANKVGVETKSGIVTLSGHVDSYAQKWAAERATQRVAGVKGLAIELDVVLPGGSRRTDADIAKAAASALEWDTSVPRDVMVLVEGGWISLSGEVEANHGRNAAESCVRHLVGVKGVINGMVIRQQAHAQDVKQKIEDALRRRALGDSNAITVGVEQGTVTLSGAVDSWDERHTVEHAAWGAPGVHNVVDNLTIG